MLYTHDGPKRSQRSLVYDLPKQESRQITHSLVGGVRSQDMVEPFLVHYPSKDGKWQISAFVYVPYNAERSGKNAAVVFIHGGPTAQTLNSFSKPFSIWSIRAFLSSRRTIALNRPRQRV